MINESRSWFFKKINKIDKPLTRIIKKKRERTQINKIRNEREEVTTDTHRNTKDCKKLLRACQRIGQTGQDGKLSKTYNLPKLNEEETESLNRLITASETRQ